jgi:hypothetical protein
LKDVVSCAILDEFSYAIPKCIVDGRDATGITRNDRGFQGLGRKLFVVIEIRFSVNPMLR